MLDGGTSWEDIDQFVNMSDAEEIKTTEAQRVEQLIDDLRPAVPVLADWVATQTAELAGPPLGTDTGSVRCQMLRFDWYKKDQRPGRQAALLRLKAALAALQSSTRNNSCRPVYESVAAEFVVLQKAWEALEKAENAYESQLHDTYAKFQEADSKTQKFRSKAGKMDAWAAKNKGRFESKDYAGAGVGPVEAETMVNSHKIYESQLAHYKDTLKVLLGIVADLKEVPAHEDSAKVADQGDALSATMAGLEDLGKAYGEGLDAKLAAEKALAEKHKEAAKEGELLLLELDNLVEAIQEPVIGNSAAACKEQLDNLNGPIAASLDACEGRLEVLEGNVKELEEAGRANLRPEIMNLVNADAAVMDGLRMAQDQRKHRLVTLQAAEEQKEKLRLAFAEVAKEVKDYCGDKQQEVEGLAETLQEQMAAVEALIAAHGDKAELMGRAEEANTAAEEAGVIINPHTTETIHSLRALWAEVATLLARCWEFIGQDRERGADFAVFAMRVSEEEDFDDLINDLGKMESGTDGSSPSSVPLTAQAAAPAAATVHAAAAPAAATPAPAPSTPVMKIRRSHAETIHRGMEAKQARRNASHKRKAEAVMGHGSDEAVKDLKDVMNDVMNDVIATATEERQRQLIIDYEKLMAKLSCPYCTSVRHDLNELRSHLLLTEDEFNKLMANERFVETRQTLAEQDADAEPNWQVLNIFRDILGVRFTTCRLRAALAGLTEATRDRLVSETRQEAADRGRELEAATNAAAKKKKKGAAKEADMSLPPPVGRRLGIAHIPPPVDSNV